MTDWVCATIVDVSRLLMILFRTTQRERRGLLSFSWTTGLLKTVVCEPRIGPLVALLVVACAKGQSPESNKFRITTWNLEWFPNGSPREAPQEKQHNAFRRRQMSQKLNPDILLLQEVRDYDACNRLAEAIQPGAYTVAICSAFKGGKQEEAIMAKIPAQAAG
jgi:hypothetical protein